MNTKFYKSYLSAKDCGPIDTPLNGTKPGNETTYPNKVTFSCDDGFNLRGSAERECTADGTWSGVETICEGKYPLKEEEHLIGWFLISFSYFIAKDCGFLKVPLNGSLVGSDLTTFPNSLLFACDEGFILRGSSVRRCQATADWSGNETFCEGNKVKGTLRK